MKLLVTVVQRVERSRKDGNIRQSFQPTYRARPFVKNQRFPIPGERPIRLVERRLIHVVSE